VKIALAQINPIIGDFDHNFEKILQYSEDAKKGSCDLVVFPEMAVSGYPPRDLLDKTDFVEANLSCLSRLVDTLQGIGVICGFVDRNPNPGGKPLFNSAVLFENGKRIFQVNKRLLPSYDVFDEERHFEPETACRSFLYKNHRIGLTVCEDIWNDKDFFKKKVYSIDPVQEMIQDGADLLINISASPFSMGKIRFRYGMISSIAKKYTTPLVYVNQVGGNDSLIFDGASCVFDRSGNRIAQGVDFGEDLVVVDTKTGEGEIHTVSASDVESVLKALVMGTADFVTKCRFSKVVIGLSGGIDSALTACIAVSALGKNNVISVFMPSRYTSADNFEDTRKLAGNLGILLLTIPINSIFEAFIQPVSPDVDRENPGITEQNIQARIRGTLLMAIANKENAILLSTGNKSELAVGYCTLYGDMNGGLDVISDVPKTMVYQLAGLINSKYPVIPRRILEKAPSAELRPNQKDQDDLPSYEVLDQILKAYIEDLKSAEDLLKMGFEPKLIEEVISRIDRNEYKRHQAPPGLKVTTRAFGYGRRIPIAQRYVWKRKIESHPYLSSGEPEPKG
jgi:NAD+ synthetase